MNARIRRVKSCLDKRLLDSFSRKILKGALRTVGDLKNPARHNQFSAGLRSIFEYQLQTLAPDRKVVRCVWFQPETKMGLPSRRQRAVYATQGGLSDPFVNSVLGFNPKPLHKRVVQAFDELSKYTHVRPGTLIEDQTEINRFVAESLEALEGLFTAIDQCRDLVSQAVLEKIDDEVFEGIISDTLNDVDVLATHYWIDEIDIEQPAINIDDEEITYHVRGTLSVGLQYGSDSDYRSDMGERYGASFPFSCALTSSTEEPLIVEIEQSSLSVDTSKFFED
jgi:hypothetical protein